MCLTDENKNLIYSATCFLRIFDSDEKKKNNNNGETSMIKSRWDTLYEIVFSRK